ncbi:MAG TPA: hypothetical protein VNZ52_10025 [Candidatus Thermoplasmatota archaeon]|nr:hypothetical protein [Candidatus Thermoplasmatota archaeon]
MSPRLRVAFLALLLLAVPFAGCVSDGIEVDNQGAGHPLSASVSRASVLRLDGLDHPGHRDGITHLRFGPGNDTGEPATLLLHDATLASGERGLLLVSSPTLSLTGSLDYRAASVLVGNERVVLALSRGNMRATELTVPGPVFEGEFFWPMAHATPVGLTLPGEVRVSGDRLVFATEAGLRNLTGPVTITGVTGAQANAPLVLEEAASRLTFEVAKRRGTLALSGAEGEARLDGGTPAALKGDTILTLARGTKVSLTSAARNLALSAEGHAYQVMVAGKPLLRARLQVEFEPATKTVGTDTQESVRLRIRNLDPNTDALLTRVGLEGAPENTVSLPRVMPVSITDQVLSTPGAMPIAAAAAPALILTDAILAFAWLFEPPAIPQMLEAGATFTTDAYVRTYGEGYTARLVLDGNFPVTEATLTVQPS